MIKSPFSNMSQANVIFKPCDTAQYEDEVSSRLGTNIELPGTLLHLRNGSKEH